VPCAPPLQPTWRSPRSWSNHHGDNHNVGKDRPTAPPPFRRCGHDHRRRPVRSDPFANSQPGKTKLPAIKPGTHTSFGPLKQIDAGALNVGYAEAGPADGPAVILLHGWPYDIYSFVDVAPLLGSAGYRVIVPYLRGYGTTRFLSGETPRNGQQSAVAVDIVALMDALKIEKATIGGFDWGARTADIIAALWPERCKALVSVSGYLIGSQEAGKAPLPPKAELQWWYQYYFATERGREGYDKYRHDFSKLIWQLASPKWNFDDASSIAQRRPSTTRITSPS
jgi:pimeloyl-ACP methyl ester carboxylesterase